MSVGSRQWLMILIKMYEMEIVVIDDTVGHSYISLWDEILPPK